MSDKRKISEKRHRSIHHKDVDMKGLIVGLVSIFIITITTILLFIEYLPDRTYIVTPNVLISTIITTVICIVFVPCIIYLPISWSIVRYIALSIVVLYFAMELGVILNIYRHTSKKHPNPYMTNFIITVATCVLVSVVSLSIMYRYRTSTFVRLYIFKCFPRIGCDTIIPTFYMYFGLANIIMYSLVFQFLIILNHEKKKHDDERTIS